MKIKHCRNCKEGRLIKHKHKSLVFCGFCGKEYDPNRIKW